MRRIRSFFYLLFAALLLAYALPRFKLGQMETMSQGFVIIWISFAVVIIGAHLYLFLDVERERTHKEIKRVRQYQSN